MAPDLLECEAHGTPTRLRCAEDGCDKPICPECLVKTAVGLKCEEHAQGVAPRFNKGAQRSAIGAIVVALVAIVGGGAALVHETSKPTPAPDNTPAPAVSGDTTGKIVPPSVYVVNVDGATGQTLTNRALAFDGRPAWAPDGQRIAFESTVDGKRSIWVMQADGQGLRRLTDAGGTQGDSAPAWSPTSDRIAYTSERDGNEEVYVIGLDGSANRRLTNSPGSDAYPAWSPDGSRIAFVSDRDGSTGVWVMGADGSAPSRLAAGTSAPSRPAWSPDGRSLAFASDRDFGNLDIYVADVPAAAAGAAPVNPRKVIAGPGLDGEPAWSPDGTKFAFASDRDGTPEVYVANVDGSNVRQLTTKSRSYQPAWAPDGAKLAYIYDPVG